jgi:hypothetical protein
MQIATNSLSCLEELTSLKKFAFKNSCTLKGGSHNIYILCYYVHITTFIFHDVFKWYND